MESIEQRVNKLLSQMTLDEKLAQIGSYWMFELQTNGVLDWDKAADKLKHGIGQITRVGGASTLEPAGAAKAVNRLQAFLVEKTRLAIPAIIHEECCAGAMMLGGTAYPQMLGLAGTFQPELAERMTTAIRGQLRAIGARQGLAPVLDVGRDPRWGRVEETFGEDATLVAHFGVAYIKGLQSENLAEGVMATGKHFVGHSLSQGGLNCAPVHLGMNEIHDVYLAPFQAAIRDAKLASIMNAYPELDGQVIAASRRILTDMLRGQLGFDGLVVSDYEAINMLHNFHKVAINTSCAAALALNAGIDVELPSAVCYGAPLKSALQNGEINMELVDTAVRRHLKKKFELGLFEDPYVDENRVLEVFETPEQRALAHEIACKSMVLLKNDGCLPLKKTIKTLAVIGPNADAPRNQLADYSYAAMRQLMEWKAPENSAFLDVQADLLSQHDVKISSVLQGIQAAVSPGTRVLYAKGCDLTGPDASTFEQARQIAQQSEAVVLVLGDRSGLTPDCTTGETRDSADLKLPRAQEDLAEALLAAGKPVVVVLINGRPLAIPALEEKANAILEAWLPGEEGGSAVAEVLFGDVNPGGKLPITFPRSVGQVPIYHSAKPAGTRSYWYVDYVSEQVTPLYPFGHGLSYTTFEYSELVIGPKQTAAGGSVDIGLRVRNAGRSAGEEVVQLYVCDEFASTPRPARELKGYRRLALDPGQTRRITFHLPVNQLAFYDNDLCLVVEPGPIKVMVGSSSADIRLTGEFEITGPKRTAVSDRVFVCPVSVE
ncbi:MAG TPA: glycoside hydrolase family 3 N-terminal domain-containing protein [Anaerolineales bacterium]|nr:glycoside hydrolase family 3 N-terminal domain-containing protein [Anaerolineales bacterium]